MTDTVLVTGATGFIAKHCIAELLRKGFKVRGTARNPERTSENVRRAVTHAEVDASHVEIVAADLTSDEGWDAAADGCRFVLHVASPFPITQPKTRDELIRPARDGALRALNAAVRVGVERVVMTSSTVAVMYTGTRSRGHVYTETDWTDTNRTDITPYIASKTVAEQAAWDWAERTPNAPELVVINPGFVQGPTLDPDLSTSLEVFRLMGNGAYPAAPRVEFPVVDVRDVAALHVSAMIHPRAAGERFIASEGSATLMGIGKKIAAALPDLKGKVPKFEMPDTMVRTIAIFDKRLRTVLPELGVVRHCDNRKAREVLGHTFRAPDEAITAAAKSLRRLHVI